MSNWNTVVQTHGQEEPVGQLVSQSSPPDLTPHSFSASKYVNRQFSCGSETENGGQRFLRLLKCGMLDRGLAFETFHDKFDRRAAEIGPTQKLLERLEFWKILFRRDLICRREKRTRKKHWRIRGLYSLRFFCSIVQHVSWTEALLFGKVRPLFSLAKRTTPCIVIWNVNRERMNVIGIICRASSCSKNNHIWPQTRKRNIFYTLARCICIERPS